LSVSVRDTPVSEAYATEENLADAPRTAKSGVKEPEGKIYMT